ncbi:hypothetical protein [Sinomonas humi]|uniref:Uncharacterized protein n=1 Tax=Sinomonas humi TaxID=1338436 RepID=A0A0B2APC4_9MICC|nr:hypothetical protein [Sinomonas humi]KHL03834.1 hypothetical protein LK10_07970 [Sinomonas humi]
MARFHYRNPKSSRRFPAIPSERTAPPATAPPRAPAAAPAPAPASAPASAPSFVARAVRRRPQQPSRARRNGLGLVSPQTTDRWRELLAPDGTPPALPYQIEYVRAAVRQETGVRPSLRGLTVGQAERILAALNIDPRPLWRGGRDSWALNVLAICGKWLAFALLFIVIFSLGRADGAPLVLLILMGFGLSAARRQRRQSYENRHYRRARQERPTTFDADDGGPRRSIPEQPHAGFANEDKGSPYDVETYLKRLGQDGR